jgi:hypothetical protein
VRSTVVEVIGWILDRISWRNCGRRERNGALGGGIAIVVVCGGQEAADVWRRMEVRFKRHLANDSGQRRILFSMRVAITIN